LNPLTDQSLWTLAVDPIIYLAIAYLIWRLAAFGRLGALVYGYISLAMYLGIAASYFVFHTPLTVTPLFIGLSAFHVLALPALLWYLQPARRKKLFHVSLWEILLSSD
jgi:peptidoglycan/LPS O-acetylase OafA/YrhL